MKLKKRSNKKLISKKYNYGLGLLKVILAFCVIRTHNLNYSTIKNKKLFRLRRGKIHYII